MATITNSQLRKIIEAYFSKEELKQICKEKFHYSSHRCLGKQKLWELVALIPKDDLKEAYLKSQENHLGIFYILLFTIFSVVVFVVMKNE